MRLADRRRGWRRSRRARRVAHGRTHTRPASRPDARALAAVGVEVVVLDACSGDASTTSTPARVELGATPAPMSSAGVPHEVSANASGTTALDLGAHLLGHLVAAAAHVRADPGARIAAAPERRASPRRCAGTTPATRPGRPACAAPTTPASGSASSTGTQSATRTSRTTPGVGGDEPVGDRHLARSSSRRRRRRRRRRAPGASAPAGAAGCRRATTTAARRPRGPGRTRGSRARGSRPRRRASSSPRPVDRFSEAYGPWLTPPWRSVNATSTGPSLSW